VVDGEVGVRVDGVIVSSSVVVVPVVPVVVSPGIVLPGADCGVVVAVCAIATVGTTRAAAATSPRYFM
jgi:hypothetical protein